MPVQLVGKQSSVERQAIVVDLSLAGAGLETEEPLVVGERVSVSLATPTMWDPLVLEAIVAWAHPIRVSTALDALGRPRTSARGGIAFDYPTPANVLAMFEMLTTLGFE
jgi:hypothetical protein